MEITVFLCLFLNRYRILFRCKTKPWRFFFSAIFNTLPDRREIALFVRNILRRRRMLQRLGRRVRRLNLHHFEFLLISYLWLLRVGPRISRSESMLTMSNLLKLLNLFHRQTLRERVLHQPTVLVRIDLLHRSPARSNAPERWSWLWLLVLLPVWL